MTVFPAFYEEIQNSLGQGKLVPYLGPGVHALDSQSNAFPTTPQALATFLTGKTSVPHKIRNNLTAAAQFIENFKHRKSLVRFMEQAFSGVGTPNPLHQLICTLHPLPRLVVDTWYDTIMAQSLQGVPLWGQIQGVSQAEHYGEWVRYYDSAGCPVEAVQAQSWNLVLYKPWGAYGPEKNFIISDSDFVEVLTEIDIQTPIPPAVQQLRVNANFLFLGCRFDNQLTRAYARQIMKRSSLKHWAVMEGPLTRMEQQFVKEQQIEVIDLSLQGFMQGWESRLQPPQLLQTLIDA